MCKFFMFVSPTANQFIYKSMILWHKFFHEDSEKLAVNRFGFKTNGKISHFFKVSA